MDILDQNSSEMDLKNGYSLIINVDKDDGEDFLYYCEQYEYESVHVGIQEMVKNIINSFGLPPIGLNISVYVPTEPEFCEDFRVSRLDFGGPRLYVTLVLKK